MNSMNMQERVTRFETMFAEGRLIRNKWRGEANGRETACWLAALSPEAGSSGSSSACPADVMPTWLAYLTPWLDDAGSQEAWPSNARRFAALARRWHVLSPEAWTRLDYTVRGAAVSEAMKHTKNEHVLACCDVSVELCRRASTGDMPTVEEFSAASSAAESAASSAASSAAYSAAESAAWSAAYSAAWSAASDRLIDATLTLIEAACTEAEKA